MVIKSKIVNLIVGVLCLSLLVLCFLFLFKRPFLGQKMSMDYITNSKFEIKNCKRELGFSQKLIGAYDNVSYCMHFPIFDNRKWNNIVFDEINDKIYCYRKSCLDSKIINDKFELFSNYQTFRCGDNDDSVSIQMQFYEKNLDKKKNSEIIETFVFSGDELIDENKFFKRNHLHKIVDEIRKAFVAKFPKQKNINFNKILPYSLKTLHNFVVTGGHIIFFYGRGRLIPNKEIVSIEVDRGKLSNYINYYRNNKFKRVDSSEKRKPMVALTFDDGPEEGTTDKLLEILKENEAKATFFVIGRQAEKYPELLKKMVSYNCEIGNHTYSHPNLNSLSERKVKDEIGRTNNIIETITDGYRPKLMRPPGNNCNNKVKNMLKQPIIQWSIDTLDWKHRSSAKTIETVLNHVTDGSIILMHDIHEETIEAAKVIIPKLIEKGFDLVTVSEMAEIKGENLMAHNKYSRIKNVS